ncbi:MAG TPA: carboxypeptidase-like regulatory domain-containing protein [Solirubrobacteraceae bacterium]|nr:carboxypeptidase-like regulatory domain-containing protein [Solirubrobacteraceae bacterium]
MRQCSASAPSIAPGWSVFTGSTQAVAVLSDGCGSGGLLGDLVESNGQSGAVTEEGSNGGVVGIQVAVPASAPDVTIRSLTAKVTAAPVSGDDAYLGFDSEGQELPCLALLQDSSGVGYQRTDSWTLPQGARYFQTSVYCTTDHSHTTCDFSPASQVPALSEITLTLQDNTPPTISSATGPLASAATSNATVSGTQELSFAGSDTDSGLLSAKLTLTPQAGGAAVTHTFDFSGECAYDSWNACPIKQAVSGYPLDSTTLKDGTYTVDLALTDAAGNTTTNTLGSITTRNAPTNTALPTMTASELVVGVPVGSLPGSWSAPSGAGSISYSYQWQDCDSHGEHCTSIGDAQGASYTPVASDVGHTLRMLLTATDSDGSSTQATAPSAVVAPAQGSLGAGPGPGGSGSGSGNSGGSSGATGTGSSSNNSASNNASSSGDGSGSGASGAGSPGTGSTVGSAGVSAGASNGPGLPNGVGASESAQLTLGDQRVISRSFARRVFKVSGRLRAATGEPIAGATLAILAQAQESTASRVVAHARTRANGTFTVKVPAGPSRTVTVAYRAFSANAAYAAQARVKESVAAGVRLSIAPVQVSAAGEIVLTGQVFGPVPAQGALVELLVHYKGRWVPIPASHTEGATRRTDASGHFVVAYKFQGATGRFPFRAVVPGGQAGLPYTRGYSDTVDVRAT